MFFLVLLHFLDLTSLFSLMTCLPLFLLFPFSLLYHPRSYLSFPSPCFISKLVDRLSRVQAEEAPRAARELVTDHDL